MTGSGKSTLLAIILGDHPRSFTEDVSLFGKPRDKQATATRKWWLPFPHETNCFVLTGYFLEWAVQQEIGHVSPEIFNAFPRRYGPDALTAYEVRCSRHWVRNTLPTGCC